jgi:peptidoglycan/xylan/chitin deacetylase (PgdA/CDA1 family)
MILKRVVEDTLVGSGVAAIASGRLRGQTLILAYHNIVPDDVAPGGDRSLHLPRRAFAEQLDLVQEHCEVVALDAVRDTAPVDGRPRVALTFDDAYRGAVTCGVAELARRGLPATIFIAPAFVGGQSFWWDALSSDACAGPPPELRERALSALGGDDRAVRAAAAADHLAVRDVAPAMCVASEDELRAAARYEGVTYGSHSWSHPNLASLSEDALANELRRPLAWLWARFERVSTWVSYPYGLSGPTTAGAAAAAGYSGALAISGGWIPRGGQLAFVLPRLNVPSGLSRAGLRLRLAGFFS